MKPLVPLTDQLKFYQFSQLPVGSMGFVDSSWLEITDYSLLLCHFSQFHRASVCVSKYLLEYFKLSVLDLSLMEKDEIKLLIVDGAEGVKNLVFYLGLVGFSQRVKTSIDGRFKRVFWHVVGEKGFNFISKKAAFYNPSWIAKFSKRPEYELLDTSILHSEIMLVGLKTFLQLYLPIGEEIVFRVHLMFPKSLIDQLKLDSQYTALSDKERSIFHKVVLSVFREINT